MGVGGIGIWQLLIILLIVVMLFGTKKLRNLGSDLGGALKGFKTAMKDDQAEVESEESDESNSTQEVETVSLLDLYEGSVADINPFLNRRADAHSRGPVVTVSEISALLLDHLSSEQALTFIEKAKTSGMITKDESVELVSIIGLANPAINDDGAEHLPHRTLLMFGSMVEAWRNSQSEGA